MRLPLGDTAVQGKLFELYVPTAHGGELHFESTKSVGKLVRLKDQSEVQVFTEVSSRGKPKKSTAKIDALRHGDYHLDFVETTQVSCVLIQQGCAMAGSELAVWNFWYWPFNPNYAQGYGPTQAVTALQNYTEAVGLGASKKSQAKNYEERHHKDGSAKDWVGHCNMATCASVLFKRPSGTKTLNGKTFTIAELKLLAAEFAGNFGKEKDVWLLKTSPEDKKHTGFFSLAYFKPDEPASFKRSTLEDLRASGVLPGDDWVGIEKLIGKRSDADKMSDKDIKARVEKGFGAAARTFYQALVENLLLEDIPLISNMRGDEGSLPPDEVWNQVFVKFIATFRETENSDDKKDITIECLLLSSDDTVDPAAELTISTDAKNTSGLDNELAFHHCWRLQFSNSGKAKIDNKNAWIHVKNVQDESLYAPTDMTRVMKCHKDRKADADGNMVVGHELWAEHDDGSGGKVRLLEMHTEYQPPS